LNLFVMTKLTTDTNIISIWMRDQNELFFTKKIAG
jgi:hypothetical protein